MQRERTPTQEEFAKLLHWIAEDCDEAARKLLVIQARVTKIFISRGCVDAEMLTDEITNRIAVRIDKVREKYPEPLRCFIGFLENVYHEYIRDQKNRRKANPPPQPRPADVLERENQCLNKCLGELPAQERNIVVRYFGGDGAQRREERKKLAIELAITANALRIQAHRLRKKVLKCLSGCLNQT